MGYEIKYTTKPPSSSGLGHQILILKITGSNPVGGTIVKM